MNYINQIKFSKDDPNNYDIDINLLKDYFSHHNISEKDKVIFLSNHIKITKDLFPKIYASIELAFNNLKINKSDKYNFYIKSSADINASCMVSPRTDKVDIIIHSRMIEILDKFELASVIGHELAHYFYSHYLYPAPKVAKNEIGFVNKLHLQKAAEISADRVGLIASGQLDFSLRSMFKTVSGLPKEFIEFNFNKLLEQLDDLKQIKNNYSQLYSSHPSILNRIEALMLFSQSDIYTKNFLKKNNHKFSIHEVDHIIQNNIETVIGDEFNQLNKETYNNIKMWSSISLFLTDKKFSKEEQKIFSDYFGEEKLEEVKIFISNSDDKIIEEKLKFSANNASELRQMDKELLLKEIETLASKIEGDQQTILTKLSVIAEILNIKRSVTIRNV